MCHPECPKCRIWLSRGDVQFQFRLWNLKGCDSPEIIWVHNKHRMNAVTFSQSQPVLLITTQLFRNQSAKKKFASSNERILFCLSARIKNTFRILLIHSLRNQYSQWKVAFSAISHIKNTKIKLNFQELKFSLRLVESKWDILVAGKNSQLVGAQPSSAPPPSCAQPSFQPSAAASRLLLHGNIMFGLHLLLLWITKFA